ncbi:MAG: hypothetical protein Ct9H300mP25_02180 [Acidobacteriota bacterium]|nr:MAG: hypothetical protein Ct9H300mP25_02180 [Acidobacteriota bacterium]
MVLPWSDSWYGGRSTVTRRISERSRGEDDTIGAVGRLDDVSKAALYLCSDLASYVTGVTLVVDGGLWLASSRMADVWAEGVGARKRRNPHLKFSRPLTARWF